MPCSPGTRWTRLTALGWLLLHAGKADEARQAFEHAAPDPSPVVRASASEGLRRTGRDQN